MLIEGLEHKLSQCVHCGMCLSVCPTYKIFGYETDSPRGRITLIKALNDGRLVLNEEFADHIDRCLDCRACQTACPSGVEYGLIIEEAKAYLYRKNPPNFFVKLLLRIVTRFVIPSRRVLRTLTSFLFVYQKLRINKLVRKVLPTKLRELEKMLPPLPSPSKYSYFKKDTVYGPIGEKRGRVYFFAGCVQDAFFPNVNRDTIDVLRYNGYEVVVPSAQTCCGAVHMHGGDPEYAKVVAKRNMEAFSENIPIIVNAAGCGAFLKEYNRLFGEEETKEWRRRIKDINEFLAENGFRKPKGWVNMKITYQDPCHLAHAQGIRSQPREILKSIPGLDFREMKPPDTCCGSAGVYNIVHRDISMRILKMKLEDIERTGADYVVTANPGCQIQLTYGIGKRVYHIVELLAEAYRNEKT